VKTVSDKVVRYSLAYIYPCNNGWWGRPLLRENLSDTDTPPFKMPIFARRVSAVTLVKKVQLSRVWSSLRALQWA